jgi:hypothetical protein
MMMKRSSGWSWLISLIVVAGCVHDPFINPDDPAFQPIDGCTTDGTVCFESNVLPIFVSMCGKAGCHDAQSHKEGYILTTYANIVSKGVKPGNANESEIYKVLFKDGEDKMPPDATMTQAQKDSIKVWINQGAKNTTDCNCYCDPSQFTFAAIIQPLINRNCVNCHKPGSLGGGIDLSTYNAIKTQVTNTKLYGSITHSTGYKPMPQGGKLSDCEITQISNWIEAGYPNN